MTKIGINEFISIDLKTRVPASRFGFTPMPLFFIKNSFIGRGQSVFFDSVDSLNELMIDDNSKRFVEEFFSFKDKLENAPQGLVLANSTLEPLTARFVSAKLPDTPAGLSDKDISIAGVLRLCFDGKEYALHITLDLKKTWQDITEALQKVLADKLSATAFKNIKVEWWANQKRLVLDAGVAGNHKITAARDITDVNLNKMLGFDKRGIPFFGGDKIEFADNVNNVIESIKGRVNIIAWDNYFATPKDAKLAKLVEKNERERLCNVFCFSSDKKEQEEDFIKELPKVAFCYDTSAIEEGFYLRPTVAFLLCQLYSATRFVEGSQISDFTRFITKIPADVTSVEDKRLLEQKRANFIIALEFGAYKNNLFQGGKVWGNRNNPYQLRTLLGEQWLRYNIQLTLLELMTSSQALTESTADIARVEAILSNVATTAVRFGIFAPAANMSVETRKLLERDILEVLLAQNYYLKVWPSKETVKNPDGSDRQEWVIKYELHYFAGNSIEKIVGTHINYS